MNFFEDTAREYIKALVIYYDTTNDDEISTLSFEQLLDKMIIHPDSKPYLIGFKSIEKRTHASLIHTVNKIWADEFQNSLNIQLSL